jgi:uncharacterized membrane protein
MYGWMFFIHLASLAAWFGVTLMGVIMLLSMKGKLAESQLTSVAQNIVRQINRITHPAAFLVLASGLYMIMQWDRNGMPFWLAFMERAGGMVIILFMILVSIFGAKVRKTLAQGDGASAAKSINTYAAVTFIFLLGVLAVTLVVSLKL